MVVDFPGKYILDKSFLTICTIYNFHIFYTVNNLKYCTCIVLRKTISVFLLFKRIEMLNLFQKRLKYIRNTVLGLDSKDLKRFN